jgi:integrase
MTKHHDFKFEATSNRRRNSLNDSQFIIKDVINDVEYQIDWPQITSNLKMQILGKQLVIDFCKGYADSSQQLLRRWSTIRLFVENFQRLCIYVERYQSDIPLSMWSFSTLQDYLTKVLLKEVRISNRHYTDKTSDIASYTIVQGACYLIHRTYRLKVLDKAVDGFCYQFNPKDFLKVALKDTFKGLRSDYFDWTRRKHWPSIPLEISTLLLRDAIKCIRSPLTSTLVEFFKFQRSKQKIHYNNLQGKIEKGFNDFCISGECRTRQERNRYKKLKEILENNLQCSEYKNLKQFPWTQGDIKDHCDRIYDNCLIILLALSGARVSELVPIRCSDYEKTMSGEWVYRSEILKTNYGCPELRIMSGLLREAAGVMENLSYIDKRENQLPLVGRYFYLSDFNTSKVRETAFRSQDKRSISVRLKKFYDKFCVKYGQEYRDKHATISPHQFRHTFAGYALRRFDGNVAEAIRAHFRHKAGSNILSAYTESKLNQAQLQTLEHDYIKELMQRMAVSEPEEWFGSAALRVKKSINDNVTFLNMDDVNEYINEFIEAGAQISVHPYGYCLVNDATAHKAKCFDKSSGIPNLKKGCFELCSGCTNSCYSKSGHLENLKRIALSHYDFLHGYPIKIRAALKTKSENILRRAECLIAEMENSNEPT